MKEGSRVRRFPLKSLRDELSRVYSAAAPETISMISRVMDA